ncbi:kinase-like domain-containing protein [Verticillium dahliae]|nr:kinase-like domain-containing protein [Verticillium dahliae]
MLADIIRLMRSYSASIFVSFSNTFLRVFRLIFVGRINDLPVDNTPDVEAEASLILREFPLLTDDQYKQSRKRFIKSLDDNAICALASRYNNGKFCRVVGKASGSFNVCVFIEFYEDSAKWIVRIPIEPAFDDAWIKIKSEVATMRYLKLETQVPVPIVHAYGRDVCLTLENERTQMFLITEFIHGCSLNKKLLINAKYEHRTRFFSQLIDILAELRRLEFPAIGSLTPSSDGSPGPDVGPVISMSAVTLRQPHHRTLSLAHRLPHKPFASTVDYMEYQINLISDFISIPVADLTEDDIKEEIAAFFAMKQAIRELSGPSADGEPFVLHHQDMRGANIIVDDELNIQGIIDWEFTSTIPRRIFTPPSWITGHDLDEGSEETHAEFFDILVKKGQADDRFAKLKQEWYGDGGIDQKNPAFCIAHVFRRPPDVLDIFSPLDESGESYKEQLSGFFTQSVTLTQLVQSRVEQCGRYTEWLKQNDLYITEVDSLLARSEALKAKFQ